MLADLGEPGDGRLFEGRRETPMTTLMADEREQSVTLEPRGARPLNAPVPLAPCPG